ncbi:iron complex outermembrane receptor protein [Rhizobium sp. SG_E_25_P2]|uniref:TonB-dependent siderophore receptor n=1 Tax=Rhizobium sp. SG_E_25_P2 TaxID=2879942 RepID=UPI0024759403|nr:TonB-dependent siderophore receptor [Rhizobium sp. SG_E_25_P2]MDH6267748.1 iron complex outermembrane receptor protein [Rhizobium sp. SG_E_25_P2]
MSGQDFRGPRGRGGVARSSDQSKALIVIGIAALSAISAADVSAEEKPTVLAPIVIKSDRDGKQEDASIVAQDTDVGAKTDTPILDVPAAVSVVTEKELEERGVKNMQQAVSYTASVIGDEYGSDDRYDYFQIRGFDQTTLGLYRDGLPMRITGWTSARLEPYGLQRVEVLKGSTSTLFGLNAPGGLINAVTKHPQEESHAEVYTRLGEDHIETGTDFGGALDKDGVLTYRFTGLWQDAANGYDYSNDNRLYVAPALTISPDAATSLTILTDYSKRDGTPGNGFPAAVDIDPDTFLGEPEFNRFDTKQYDVGYEFRHEFDNGLTFRQNARYSRVDVDYRQVYGGGSDASVNREAFSVDGRSDFYTIDNQLQYDASFGPVDSKTLAGFDYSYNKTDELALYGSATGIDPYDLHYCGASCVTLNPYLDRIVRQKAAGVYMQEQLTFYDRWLLTLGGRYDHVDTDTLDRSTNSSTGLSAHAFTKRVGLTYKATDEVAIYANYSESFEPVTSVYGMTGTPKPQEGRQYEVGVKYKPDFFDALVTASVFDLTQTNAPTYVSTIEQRQIGKVGVRGAEFEAKMALNDKLNMTLAYAYWDAEIKEDGIGGNIGNRPSRTPEHVASAWLAYTVPGEGARGDLTVGGGVRYVGQTYGDDANTVSISPHTLIDATANYKVTKNVDFNVSVTNLLDTKYVSTIYYGSKYYGDRRTALATLKYSW